MAWPIMGGDKKRKGPAGTSVIADVRGGRAALFLLCLVYYLYLDKIVLVFSSVLDGIYVWMKYLFKYNNTFCTVLSGVLSFIYQIKEKWKGTIYQRRWKKVIEDFDFKLYEESGSSFSK